MIYTDTRHVGTEKDPCVALHDPLWPQCTAVSGVKSSSDIDSAAEGHLWKTEGLELRVGVPASTCRGPPVCKLRTGWRPSPSLLPLSHVISGLDPCS